MPLPLLMLPAENAERKTKTKKTYAQGNFLPRCAFDRAEGFRCVGGLDWDGGGDGRRVEERGDEGERAMG